MSRLLALALAALALVVVMAACGGDETVQPTPETVVGNVPTGEEDGGAAGGSTAAGKAIFVSAGCGSCHALADAGTSGSVGPNLDESSVTVEAAITQIENGGGGMPGYSGQLSEEEITELATYVVAARG